MEIRKIRNEWRDALVPASFRGIAFHVETGSRESGRRTVVHEYPKRNVPYSEDMGRHAVRWSFSAYLILRDRGPDMNRNLLAQRNALIGALEDDDAGILVHPSLDGQYRSMLVMCERYQYAEQRERGGYLQFDMQFVEAGNAPTMQMVDSRSALINAASAAEGSARQSLNSATAYMWQRGLVTT